MVVSGQWSVVSKNKVNPNASEVAPPSMKIAKRCELRIVSRRRVRGLCGTALLLLTCRLVDLQTYFQSQ